MRPRIETDNVVVSVLVRTIVRYSYVVSQGARPQCICRFLFCLRARFPFSTCDSRPAIIDSRPRPATRNSSSHLRPPRAQIPGLGSQGRDPTHSFLTTTLSLICGLLGHLARLALNFPFPDLPA